LALAEDRFDVLITVDRKLEALFQRDPPRLGLVMLIDLTSNRLDCLLPLFDQLRVAAEMVKAGQVIHVSGTGTRRV